MLTIAGGALIAVFALVVLELVWGAVDAIFGITGTR
jgi:hypothetical protein